MGKNQSPAPIPAVWLLSGIGLVASSIFSGDFQPRDTDREDGFSTMLGDNDFFYFLLFNHAG